MAPEVFSAAGRRLDIEVRKGATLGPIPHAIVLDDGSETPFDLSGYTFRGGVQSYSDPSVFVDFDFDVTRLDEGVYTFSLTDEKTDQLTAGDNIFARASFHKFQTEMEDEDGNIIPLFYGELRVLPALTPA